MKRIVVAELIATARQATDLDEFGEPSLHPALDMLVDSIHDEARLTDFGLTREQIAEACAEYRAMFISGSSS